MNEEFEKAMENVSSLLTTPNPTIEIIFGTRYHISQAVTTMDTMYIMRIASAFIERVGKENILIEVSAAGKQLPKMDLDKPYIVIESTAKGILRAKKNLSKRKYVKVLDDDFKESEQLALMVFTIR